MNDAALVALRRLRAPIVLLVLVFAVGIVGLVLIPGTDATGQPWRMTPEPEILVRSTGDGTSAHLANWLDCIRSRRTPSAPVPVGVAAARAAHIANQSVLAGGARVRWNASAGKVERA